MTSTAVPGRRPGIRTTTMLAYVALVGCSLDSETGAVDAQTADFPYAEVSASSDPLALLEDVDPQLAANKLLVFDMWRSIVNAGHVELADEMLREDYIQHSPVLPTGRAGFKAVFAAVPRSEIPEVVAPPLVAIIAEGDLVVMALREEIEGDAHYSTTHFNLFRVEDGRLAEHWHSVAEAPGPGVLPPGEGGPQPVIGALGEQQQALLVSSDPALTANKQLVFDVLHSLFSEGSVGEAMTYLSTTFVEHDPNGFAGRELFGPSNGDWLGAPLVALLAEGELVVAVTGREHPHPLREGETYTTTRFDMFRIESGGIAEHWSGAARNGQPGRSWGEEG